MASQILASEVNKNKRTHLNTLQAQDTGFLLLQPLENFVRVVAIHIRLLRQRERHTVVELAERRDLFVRAWFLTAELRSQIRRHYINDLPFR